MSHKLDPRFLPESQMPPIARRTRPSANTGGMVIGVFALAAALVGGLLLLGEPGRVAQMAARIQTPQAPALPELKSPAITLLSAEAAVRPRLIRREFAQLAPRDTLSDLLDKLGADRAEANAALFTLYDGKLIDPRRLQPGLDVEAVFEDMQEEGRQEEDGQDADAVPGALAPRLIGLVLNPDPDRALTVARLADGRYVARETHVSLSPAYRRVAGTIETSLYEAALDEGAGDQQVVDFAQIFAYDVDFQREIRRGDTFEMVFEAFVDERGRPVRAGELVYAELNGHFTDKAFYRFTPADDGITDYFDAEGESARKFLMKTPINGARLSSGFGLRRHPISGYTKMHKGTDFAAPTGTPVYAAGNGVVVRADRFGGYGNYVRIKHANGYETAYAHLSRFGPGIKKGTRVRQGDVIGYVGTTGASTGPHLHYEVLLDGVQIDPISLKLPTGRKLEGEFLSVFETEREGIDALRSGLGAETESRRKTTLATLPPAGPDASR